MHVNLHGFLYTQDRIISQNKAIVPDFMNQSSELKQEIGNKRMIFYLTGTGSWGGGKPSLN